jgi:hypothetical protein
MSIQINSNVTLQVVLGAAITTSQLPCSASFVDQGGAGGDNTINTNGTTAVTLVGAPGASIERLISNVSIPNADTASATVTVNKVVSGTPYRLVKVTLLPGYALYYDGNWRVMDPNGNFLCDVAVSSGSITSNQGTAAAITAPWPVELSNGTAAVGTSSVPLRIDPTGTTTQPVNLASLNGTALAGPTAWGVAPSAGAEVQNVNAYIVSGGSGGGNVNVTQWNTVNLGSPSNYGTSPGAVSVIGVNAFVTNTLTINTHAVTQSGTWTVALSAGSAAIGTVGITSLPALPSGSNVIGAVTQSAGPWTINLTQVGGSALALGQTTMASSVPVTIASNQSAVQTEDLGTAANITAFSVTSTAQNWGSSATKYLQGIQIDLVGVTSSSAVVVNILDGGGNTLFSFGFGVIGTATTNWNIKNFTNLAKALANAGGQPTLKLTNALTAGSVFVTLLYT